MIRFLGSEARGRIGRIIPNRLFACFFACYPRIIDLVDGNMECEIFCSRERSSTLDIANILCQLNLRHLSARQGCNTLS